MEDDFVSNAMLQQLALQFTSLKQLEIKLRDLAQPSFLFWKLLKPMLKKNNCQTKFSYDSWSHDKWNQFITIMNENDLKIDKLKINVGDCNAALKLNCISNVHRLTIFSDRYGKDRERYTIECREADDKVDDTDCRNRVNKTSKNDTRDCYDHEDLLVSTINSISDKYLSNKELFKSLVWIHIHGNMTKSSSITDIFKRMKTMIIDKQLVIVMRVRTHYSYHDDDESQFEILCQTLYQLITKERIAIDIKATIESQKKQLYEKCNSIFLSYFGNGNTKLLDQYQQPNSNEMICQPRKTPRTSFYDKLENTSSNSWYYKSLCALNVSNCSRKIY